MRVDSLPLTIATHNFFWVAQSPSTTSKSNVVYTTQSFFSPALKQAIAACHGHIGASKIAEGDPSAKGAHGIVVALPNNANKKETGVLEQRLNQPPFLMRMRVKSIGVTTPSFFAHLGTNKTLMFGAQTWQTYAKCYHESLNTNISAALFAIGGHLYAIGTRPVFSETTYFHPGGWERAVRNIAERITPTAAVSFVYY